MLKTFTAIVTAAMIAGIATLLSAPTGGPVSAGPIAAPAEAALKECTQRPWPYNTCVGTAVGNPRIRLVTTDRLAGQ
jgi:hypothetical protein